LVCLIGIGGLALNVFRLRLKEFEPEIGPVFGFHLGLRRESALPFFQLRFGAVSGSAGR
jgi:hypothetical protein